MNNNSNGCPFSRQYGNQTGAQMQLPYSSGTTGSPYQSLQQMPMYPLAPIGTTLPTGVPAGTNMAPMPLPSSLMPMPSLGEQTPETLTNSQYTPGFLRTQIGRRMRVEFLIGNGALIDRTGTLVGVGTSYILLRLIESDDIIMCDMYSIKFVTIFM